MNIAEVLNTYMSNTSSANRTADVQSSENNFDSYLNAATTTMDDIFQKAADTYGVSVNLLKAMAKQESNFDPNSTSSCGAMGVMQLMPETAASLGVTDAYDPEQNIMGGAKYISQLLTKYNGDVSLALAAYNAGSGNVDKYGGIPPFEETQNYVAKVTAYMNENLTIDDSHNQVSSSDFLNALSKGLDTIKGDTEVQAVLDYLYSEEDYEKFVEVFLTELNSVMETTDGFSSTSSAQEAYANQQIQYTPAVMNLVIYRSDN